MMVGMANSVIGVVLPLVSALVGAGLTYFLNVRYRRRTNIEDLFNAAIAAVAVADASKHYSPGVSRPEHLSDKDYRELRSGLGRNAVEAHFRRAAEAREAVARVVQYEPKVRDYYQDASTIEDKPDEIRDLLVEARQRFIRQRTRWWPSPTR